MVYITLILICLISVEILRSIKFFHYSDMMFLFLIKIKNVISSNKISDTWKEKIIIKYSCMLMKFSILLLISMMLIILIFFLVDLSIDGFISTSLSLLGICISLISVMGYLWLKKFFRNE